MTYGPDGNLWIATNGTIAKVSPTGSMTTYAANSTGSSISEGPGGALYFPATGSSVGKISLSGSVQYIALPSGLGVNYVTLGPDGNVWFTAQSYDQTYNEIGAVKADGTVAEYPCCTYGPWWIVAGPDGNLWFTDEISMMKSTTSGSITFVQQCPDLFEQLTTYKGSIWTVCGAPGAMGTFTFYLGSVYGPSGGCTYEDNGYNGYPDAMTGGPDNSIWGNKFITDTGLETCNLMTGTMSHVDLPHSQFLLGIASGSGGEVWVATQGYLDVYEASVKTISMNANDAPFDDPNYGFELGYALGSNTQTQTISLRAGEAVRFTNSDTVPHDAAFLGNATKNSAPWPSSFTGKTARRPARSAIGNVCFSTGKIEPGASSLIYNAGPPGFYMIGDQYDYASKHMRTVIVVH